MSCIKLQLAGLAKTGSLRFVVTLLGWEAFLAIPSNPQHLGLRLCEAKVNTAINAIAGRSNLKPTLRAAQKGIVFMSRAAAFVFAYHNRVYYLYPMPHEKQVKSVLNKHKKRDSWFLDDFAVNPYEGCSCNCLYCYIRGSKYGTNMDEGLAVKINALEILDKQLAARAKKNQYGFVAVGSGTDAYIHHEKKYKLTEGILRLLLKHRFPVFISTKCTLITRDIGLLKEIDKSAILPGDLANKLKRGVILSVSVSTMDEKISNMLEPVAAPPLLRLELVQQLKKEGFVVGVNAIPVLPYISDSEESLEMIIASAKAYGADYVLVGGLTLFGNEPSDSKTLFYKFLTRYESSLLPKYEQLYGSNYYVPFRYQDQLKARASRICSKYEIRNSILV